MKKLAPSFSSSQKRLFLHIGSAFSYLKSSIQQTSRRSYDDLGLQVPRNFSFAEEKQRILVSSETAAGSMELIDQCSFITTIFALLCSLLVAATLISKENHRRKSNGTTPPSRKLVFENLTHYSISWMILSDILHEVVLLLSQYVTQLQYKLVLGELADTFYAASVFWGLFIAISMFFAIKEMVTPSLMGELLPKSNDRLSSSCRCFFANLVKCLTATKKVNKEKESEGSNFYYSLVDEDDSNAVNRFMLLRKLEKRLKMLLHVVAWGIPLLSFVVWTFVLDYFSFFNLTRRYIVTVSLIYNSIKAALLVGFEGCALGFRYIISVYIHDAFSKTCVVSSKYIAEQRQKEEKALTRKMILYSTPFIVCGIWRVAYRATLNFDTILLVANHGFNFSVTTTTVISNFLIAMISIHKIVTPLTGVMDAIVYCFTSKWFMAKLPRFLVFGSN